jgi:CheY-like chemotaxis protein
MPDNERSAVRAAARGVRVLVADDDAALRMFYVCVIRKIDGVSSVVAAEDGAAAERLARDLPLHVAILDLNMPRLDGVETATRLRAMQPSLRIALQSADAPALWERARGLHVPLFDKLEIDRLTDWIEAQTEWWRALDADPPQARVAPLARKLERRCSLCGYGIVSRDAPERCPICGAASAWAQVSTQDDGSQSRVHPFAG